MTKILLSKEMWAGRTNKTLVFGLVMMAAAVLAASLLVLASAMRPAEAAFPGPSGAIAYTCCDQGDLNVWRMAPDGFGATKLTEDTAYDSQPVFSAEGTQITFNSRRDDGDGTNDWDIYRMNAAGNSERNLTPDGATVNTADDVEPYWFPNDTRVAFRRDETGTDSNIWVLTLDENGQPTGERRLTTNPAGDKLPAVSPNGKLIAFASDRDGDWEIYVMKANVPEGPTNVPTKLTKNTNPTADPDEMSDLNPDWSPSGKQIVFESNREGRFDEEIFVMNVDAPTRPTSPRTRSSET